MLLKHKMPTAYALNFLGHVSKAGEVEGICFFVQIDRHITIGLNNGLWQVQ